MREITADWNAHPGRVKVKLRVSMTAAVEAAHRLALPAALCARKTGEVAALWLGPDLWLLTSDRESASQMIARCAATLGSLLHHAVDQSAALACARVQGARVRELLSAASGVDWRTSGFHEGRCVRTRFARVAVVVHAIESESVELYYDRSYRHYLERWYAYAIGDPSFASPSCPITS